MNYRLVERCGDQCVDRLDTNCVEIHCDQLVERYIDLSVAKYVAQPSKTKTKQSTEKHGTDNCIN